MKHSEVDDLLAPYALDAVEDAEQLAVEAHLSECGRCRAEVARHREVAALFSASPAEPPPTLWERIHGSLGEVPEAAVGRPEAVAVLDGARPRRDRLALAGGLLGGLAAAAAVLAIVLAVQVSSLNGKVANLTAALGRRGLDSAVAAALVRPHHEARLSSASGSATAQVVLTPSGQDYWVGSSLPKLSSGRSYQLWALVGRKPVSIALVGADPSAYSAFRLGAGATALMVTAEPAAGSPSPTGPVLVQAAVSTH